MPGSAIPAQHVPDGDGPEKLCAQPVQPDARSQECVRGRRQRVYVASEKNPTLTIWHWLGVRPISLPPRCEKVSYIEPHGCRARSMGRLAGLEYGDQKPKTSSDFSRTQPPGRSAIVRTSAVSGRAAAGGARALSESAARCPDGSDPELFSACSTGRVAGNRGLCWRALFGFVTAVRYPSPLPQLAATAWDKCGSERHVPGLSRSRKSHSGARRRFGLLATCGSAIVTGAQWRTSRLAAARHKLLRDADGTLRHTGYRRAAYHSRRGQELTRRCPRRWGYSAWGANVSRGPVDAQVVCEPMRSRR